MVDENFDRRSQASHSELNRFSPHFGSSAAPSPTLSKCWSRSNIRHLRQQSRLVPAPIELPPEERGLARAALLAYGRGSFSQWSNDGP